MSCGTATLATTANDGQKAKFNKRNIPFGQCIKKALCNTPVDGDDSVTYQCDALKLAATVASAIALISQI